MADDVRTVVHDLTGAAARWMLAGLLALTLGLLVTIVIVDQEVDIHQLVGVAVGMLVVGGLVLTATFALGDGVRSTLLRLRSTGSGLAEGRQHARRLALRSMVLGAVCVALLLVGLPLMVVTNR